MHFLKFALPFALFLCTVPCCADQPLYSSATISGLGARNIGSATMSGRISAIAGTREPSGKVTLFIGAASGGVWKSDDSGTRYRPVFDEQPVQSIGAIAPIDCTGCSSNTGRYRVPLSSDFQTPPLAAPIKSVTLPDGSRVPAIAEMRPLMVADPILRAPRPEIVAEL